MLADDQDPTIPFTLFPKQEEFLLWIRERERNHQVGVAEKSRDVGFSWCCLAYALHSWLFRPGTSIGFGSRELDLVDKRGDLDSLFEKLRFLLQHLPDWMQPAGFKPRIHDKQCLLENPANGARIKGDGGDEIGRGGRHLIYFIDEAAHLQRPDAVEAALSATARTRIYVSTPKGPGNPFARKRFSLPAERVFSYHWRFDPRKDDAWYAQQCEDIGDPVVIAQEIDLDYNASIEGICIPGRWVRAAVGLVLPESGEVIGGFDPAAEGRDRSVLIARRGPVVRMPIDWGQLNTTEGALKCADEAEKLGVKVLHYDSAGIGNGIKGTWKSSGRKLRFRTNAVNGGDSPSDTMWPDARTSKERFKNLRAELWWLMRRRFEMTFEFVEKGTPHPPEEMISLPDCAPLIAELSLPLYRLIESGKVQLESKPDMKKRGVKSPDFGDALAYSFAPETVWAAFSVYDDDDDDDDGPLDDDDDEE